MIHRRFTRSLWESGFLPIDEAAPAAKSAQGGYQTSGLTDPKSKNLFCYTITDGSNFLEPSGGY
jgi:hypothetical protein